MTPGTMAVLVGITVLIAAAAGLTVIAAALLWSVRQLQPQGQLRSKVAELEAMVDNLEAQVINLRTRKAAKASPRTQPRESEEMAGFTPEEQALFRDAGIM